IGKSLMETAVAGGIAGIAADCGGLLTCATCHVHVHVQEPFASHSAQLPPPDAEELAMLAFTAAPRLANSRLSCQIKLTAALDGLDRKSTRLNSSHGSISYAVFCLKKQK